MNILKKEFVKKAILGTSGLLMYLGAFAQITENEAQKVDSLLATKYLSNFVLHSENINETLSGPVFTWDNINGRYNGESVGSSFTHRVDEETAKKINSVPGQHYTLFSLEYFSDINQYAQAVENWLKEVGVPVGISDSSPLEKRLYPNPTRGNVNLEANIPAGKEYVIKILDTSNRLVRRYTGKTDKNGLSIGLNLNDLSSGMYIVNFQNEKTSFSKKMVIQ